MQLKVPDEALPMKMALNPELRMNNDQYFAFCVANRDLRIERTSGGEIVILAPHCLDTAYQCTEIAVQLWDWAKRDGRGKAWGCTEFILPTGAALSPDAAWVSNWQLSRLSEEQKRKFLPVSPDFIVEVMSPTDRLGDAQTKMEEWRRGGVELGWLIQPDKQIIYVYRTGQAGYEKRTGILRLAGEGSIAGFELELSDIWAGL